MWMGILKAVMGFGGNIVSKFQERKQKADDARVAWETAAGRSMESSWKDEYVTIIITLPLVQIFMSNLVAIWWPEKGAALMAANDASLEQVGLLMDTPYGEVMMVVVLAAVGIKGLKSVLK